MLVIHKTAMATNLLTLSEQDAAAVTRTVKEVAALEPDGFRIAQFNGAAAGQTVFHYQHTLPAWEGRSMERHRAGIAEQSELEATAAKIRAAL